MIPRSLAARIAVAFAGLALAVSVALGGALYLVLLDLHGQANRDALGRQVSATIVQLRRTPPADWPSALQDGEQGFADEGGFVMLVTRGAPSILAGNPGSVTPPPMPAGSAQTATGTLTAGDGARYTYLVFRRDANAVRSVVFAVPERASGQALADLARAMPIVVIVIVLVGAPIAWILSRSVTRPMRRLAAAAAGVPADPRGQAPLPLDGPAEVQALTERFNAMAAALGRTREDETAMLASLRHDLRTPLTSIAGYAEAIADGTASGDAATHAARTITEEAARLERLVAELGVIDRLRDGPAALRPETMEPAALLEATIARFADRAAAAGVEMSATRSSAAEPAPSFAADRLAVERILQNLVENALSVLAGGGHVWLAATPLHLPGRPAGVGLSVTDDGPGFPPGTLDRVFERFFRADRARSGGGSGLGLAIVRELARAHGGEAWAENVAPHGARVTVFLPLVANAPAPARASAEARTGRAAFRCAARR